ncbi:MAG: hypothetical protein LBN09_05695 [Clostridioides sp.]|jgi:hypothetical protein|nr:hypothetical protein [Clostridioides sp.]
MTIERLKELIDKYGIKEYFLPPDIHSIYEVAAGIKKDGNKYKVCREERYEPFDISYHNSESEAVEAFIKLYSSGVDGTINFYKEAMKELNK